MRRPHLPRLLTVTAVMAAVLAAGCSGGGGSSAAPATPAGPVEKPDITVAAVPSFDAAGLYLAQQRGFFAQAGLHVKIVPAISAETVLAQQLSGQLDITFGNYVSYILAMANQNARLHWLAPATDVTPNTQILLTLPNSPITSVTELPGRRVAINAPNNIGTLLVDSVLNNSGVPPSAVRYVAIPFPLMIKALLSHQVDAAWMPEPFVTSAEEAIGAQPLSDADVGLAQNVPLVGYVTTQSWAQKYPRTAAAFVRAVQEAQAIGDANNLAVQEAATPYIGIPLATAAIVPVPQYQQQVDPRAIQRLADLMLQFGILSHHYDTSQFAH